MGVASHTLDALGEVGGLCCSSFMFFCFCSACFCLFFQIIFFVAILFFVVSPVFCVVLLFDLLGVVLFLLFLVYRFSFFFLFVSYGASLFLLFMFFYMCLFLLFVVCLCVSSFFFVRYTLLFRFFFFCPLSANFSASSCLLLVVEGLRAVKLSSWGCARCALRVRVT